MTSDPVEKLTKFTPTGIDPAELLFAAGRATAPTPWVWKAAVAGLLAVNIACIGLLVFRSPEVPQPKAEPQPVPVVAPQPAEPQSAVEPSPEPSSYQKLHRVTDPDRLPAMEPQTIVAIPERPLNVLSARSGELD